MRNFIFFLLIVISCCFGCASADSKAKELFDTALFEEKQNNFEHAEKLYDEIMRRFPDSSLSKDAAARIQALKNKKH